jgi:3-oxoacyl-[acyl-carrier protein] reductase
MRTIEEFSGKTIFVTGCNRGIGRSIVEAFLELGANVICGTRTHDLALQSDFEKKLYLQDQTVRMLLFDLSDENSVKIAVTTIIKEQLSVDVLINNAATAEGAPFEMTSIDRLRHVFEINFFAQIGLTQRVVRLLKKSKAGRIINIGSVAGIIGDRGTLAYGGSKSALMFATKVMANELARYGITVNAVAPGVTAAGMSAQMKEDDRNNLVDASFMQREGRAEEVVNVIIFLASKASSFVNGQVIRVDGGMKN